MARSLPRGDHHFSRPCVGAGIWRLAHSDLPSPTAPTLAYPTPFRKLLEDRCRCPVRSRRLLGLGFGPGPVSGDFGTGVVGVAAEVVAPLANTTLPSKGSKGTPFESSELRLPHQAWGF